MRKFPTKGNLKAFLHTVKFQKYIIFGGAYTWRCLFSEFYGILFFILNRRLFKDNVNKPCRMHLSTFDLLCAVSYYGEGKKLNG